MMINVLYILLFIVSFISIVLFILYLEQKTKCKIMYQELKSIRQRVEDLHEMYLKCIDELREE